MPPLLLQVSGTDGRANACGVVLEGTLMLLFHHRQLNILLRYVKCMPRQRGTLPLFSGSVCQIKNRSGQIQIIRLNLFSYRDRRIPIPLSSSCSRKVDESPLYICSDELTANSISDIKTFRSPNQFSYRRLLEDKNWGQACICLTSPLGSRAFFSKLRNRGKLCLT